MVSRRRLAGPGEEGAVKSAGAGSGMAWPWCVQVGPWVSIASHALPDQSPSEPPRSRYETPVLRWTKRRPRPKKSKHMEPTKIKKTATPTGETADSKRAETKLTRETMVDLYSAQRFMPL